VYAVVKLQLGHTKRPKLGSANFFSAAQIKSAPSLILRVLVMRKLAMPRWFPTHPDWLRYLSPGQLRMMGFTSVVVCLLLMETVHFLVVPGWNLTNAWAGIIPDAIASLIIGLLVSKILTLAWERRQALQQRLDMVAEMNHHIRNALEVILSAAYQTHDSGMIACIRAATDRVLWALNEVLPEQEHERRNHEKSRNNNPVKMQ